MRQSVSTWIFLAVLSINPFVLVAQETPVPGVIQFSGILKNSAGQALAGVQGVTFALYSDQEGGAPLWIESQNVTADAEGRFSVLLGSATPGGLPVDLFSSGASRWLGVQSQSPGEPEQPRILLVSVPYALKAADAETVGGLPPSAFVLAPDAVTERVKDSGGLVAVSDGVITAQANSGSAGFIGKFFNPTDLDNSALFQSGSSIGLGTTTPETVLHIQGATTDGITVSNGLNSGIGFLRFKRTDGAIAGEIQSLLGTQAMVFRVTGAERIRIAPSGYVGIGTNSPIAQLHVSSPGSTRMLFQGDAGTNGVIGLDMDSTARRWTLGAQGTNENGAFILYDFTAGQRRMTVDSTGQFGIGTFTPSTLLDVNGTVTATAFVGDGSGLTNLPGGAGSGDITAVTAGTGLSGGGTDGDVELSFDESYGDARYGQVGTTNTFTGTQTITGGNLGLPDTADASTGVLTLGGDRFVHNFGSSNTFLGENAGNFGTSGLGTNTGVGTNALAMIGLGNSNTAVGAGAMDANISGSANTAVGKDALGASTTAASNTAVGSNALVNNTSSNNTAMGAFALDANTSGAGNVAVGKDALGGNTTGFNGTAVGISALKVNTASDNTAVGALSLDANTTGTDNTALGYLSLSTNVTGNANTAVGDRALVFNTASDNTAVGASALDANTSGSGNTAVGTVALDANTSGPDNTAVGVNALGATVSTAGNTAVGANALGANTAGGNTAVGAYALDANTTGFGNTALGKDALGANTIANNNTAVGYSALDANTTGPRNTAVGYFALDANTTGDSNTAVGASALDDNTTGDFNTAVGYSALGANTNGTENIAVGSDALRSNAGGIGNTAVGKRALYANVSGSYNVAVGSDALDSSTGDRNIAIGRLAGQNLGSGDDNIYIGNSGQASESDAIRIGNLGEIGVRTFIAGIRGVTTNNANAVTVVIDSAGQLGTVSSSRRFKYDIQDMDAASSRLLGLRPVTFRYKQAQNNGSHPLHYGLIAEEVEEVMPELVAYDEDGQPATVLYRLLPSLLLNEVQRQEEELDANEEKLSREEAELAAQQEKLSAQETEIAALIQAVQDQQARIEQLQAEVDQLKEEQGVGSQPTSLTASR